MNGPLFVWFEHESGMVDWPDAARPKSWGDAPGNPHTNGHVVVSALPPGNTDPNWRPGLIGPIPIAHGDAASGHVARILQELGHLAVEASDAEPQPAVPPKAIGRYRYPLGVDAIGRYRYPLGVDASGHARIFGVRPLPPEIPNHNGRPKVQVLVEAVGGRAWINADAEDVELTK
jgi:hypothetical protein